MSLKLSCRALTHFNFFFILWLWMFLFSCMYTACVSGAYKDQKRMSGPWEQPTITTTNVSHYRCFGNWISLLKDQKCYSMLCWVSSPSNTYLHISWISTLVSWLCFPWILLMYVFPIKVKESRLERINDYVYRAIEESLHSYKQQRFIFFHLSNSKLTTHW